MELVHHLRRRHWPTVLGYALFIGMMTAGYYYNLTFVQLGLTDLGERVLGLGEQRVATLMGLLALITCITGLAVGWLMRRTGWTRSFLAKMRLATAVVLAQTVLTAAIPWVTSEPAFVAWIVLASLALGVGVPATFSLTVDLIPVRDRGLTAALITALSYFAAAVLSSSWEIEAFRSQALPLMLAGSLGLAVLSFRGCFASAPWPFMTTLSRQHELPTFGQGRFVPAQSEPGRVKTLGVFRAYPSPSPGQQPAPPIVSASNANPKGLARARPFRTLLVLFVLMFAVYFVDSLGFLRLLETPVYMNTAWQSPELSIRLFIGVVHIITALIGGIMYANLDLRGLFLWIFGIFALVHLMYGFHNQFNLGSSAPLSMPMLYATAVSLYTVVNFALWADISTPGTISLNVALGVALSAWTATFASTALALQWRSEGMPLAQHLNLVNALSLLLFLAMLILVWLQPVGEARHKKGVGA